MAPLDSTNSIKPAKLSRRNTASPSHAHLKATAWWNASTGVSATCCRPPVSPHPMNWLRRSNIMNGFTTAAFPRKHWDTKPLFKHSRNGRKRSQLYSKRKYMIYRDLPPRQLHPFIIISRIVSPCILVVLVLNDEIIDS